MSRVTIGNNGITKGYNALTHRGVDIGWSNNEENNQVIAHSNGVVVWIQTGQKNNTKATGNASYGNCVKLKHNDNYYTLYAHLKSVKVKKGEKVKKGQVIGIMGDTGKAYGRHLHFEVRNTKDVRINPTKYIYCDLPNNNYVTYKAYDNVKNKWLPLVKSGTNEYAGNLKNPISAIQIEQYKYRVYDLVKDKWLPYVYGLEDYAGNLKNNIGGIEIVDHEFEVHIVGDKKNKWIKCESIYLPKKKIDGVRITW